MLCKMLCDVVRDVRTPQSLKSDVSTAKVMAAAGDVAVCRQMIYSDVRGCQLMLMMMLGDVIRIATAKLLLTDVRLEGCDVTSG